MVLIEVYKLMINQQQHTFVKAMPFVKFYNRTRQPVRVECNDRTYDNHLEPFLSSHLLFHLAQMLFQSFPTISDIQFSRMFHRQLKQRLLLQSKHKQLLFSVVLLVIHWKRTSSSLISARHQRSVHTNDF